MTIASAVKKMTYDLGYVNLAKGTGLGLNDHPMTFLEGAEKRVNDRYCVYTYPDGSMLQAHVHKDGEFAGIASCIQEIPTEHTE